MEQKSNKLKRNNKRDSSSTATERYSLRNKKESVNKPITRSEKRKLEKEKQELNNKKTKMDTKGKQKVGESSVTPATKSIAATTTTTTTTTSTTPLTKEEKKNVDNSLDYYNNDGEEDEEEDDVVHDQDQEDEDDDDEEQDEEEEEDDDDDEEEDDELSSVRRTLGLQMQGLFGGMMSSDSSRFRSILSSLRNGGDDPTIQLIALQELAEILSVSSEDNLAGYFSSDNFCKELVRIMKGPTISTGDDLLMGGNNTEEMDEDMMLALAMSEGFSGGNPEVMLLACRCISNLLEAMPSAISSVVFHGAIRVLCEKLKSIQYIDLAEQALYALEKISAQLPRAVVNEGGLSAVMMYFDFFSIHAQRTALRTASNCMRGIDQESFSQVIEVTPTLMNTMNYSDRSVVELTCHCWVRIAESYRNNRESLERLITLDLLKILFGLIPISGNSNAVHSGTFQDLLRIFRSISKASPQLSFELLKLGIIEAFYQILTGASTVPTDYEKPIHINLDTKWRDSVPTIMKTIVDLLPSLPKDDMFSSRRFKENLLRNEPDITIDPRVEWFQNDPTALLKMDTILIPLILDIYASTVNLRVRQLVTHTLVKLIHYSDVSTLSKVLKNVSLSSFLSGILTRQEHPALLIDALYQTELLIKKLPEIYHFLFEREGVLYEIENISKLPLVPEGTEEDQVSQEKKADLNNTTVDESDDTTATTTDVEKKEENLRKDQSDDEEDQEEDEEEEESSSSTNPPPSSSTTTTTTTTNDARRRLFDRGDLQALLRSRYDLLQQRLNRQQQQQQHQQPIEAEKGVGKGSTRKYIIQLAQYFIENYAVKDGTTSTGNSLKEIIQFTNQLTHPTPEDPLSEKTLKKLSIYLRDSIMGISSFELINSGLMKALLTYLTTTNDKNMVSPLQDRINLFESIFIKNPDLDQNQNNALKKLVVRLQEILSRSEAFEVVTPLESSSNESLRNPTSMLAKQLRLRLSGSGDDIPTAYKQLMVSTHAVATFRVLEEYLLARINTSNVYDMDDDEEEEEDEETEQHVLIDDGKDEMDIDDQPEDEDVEMADAVVVKTEDEEDTENDTTKASSSSSSSSSANKKKEEEGEWKIQFSLHGTVIPNDSTVYAAVHQYEMNPENEHRKGRNFWSTSYPITYERIFVSAAKVSEAEAKQASSTPTRQLANVVRPKELSEDSTCSQVLDLLKALSPAIAKCPVGISSQDFINRKLTAKMNRQLEEPLIVASSCLPAWTYWLMDVAPFLFPFETRYLFIQSTSFGYSRLIARWQSLQMRNNTQNGPRNDDQQPVLGRMERQKVRIVRSQMLESAIKILDLFGSSPTVLEIEYMGEEGTGMGPTLEFYASTSKEFSKHSLNMWRGSIKSEKGYVDSPHGLFPKTLAKSSSRSTKKIIHLYKTLGQFIAKGLLDFRIIDIPFSPAFFKVALDRVKLSPELLMEIDPVLAKSINMLQSFIEKKREINSDTTKSHKEKVKAIKDIRVDDASLDDLCLDFTLPGDQTYELKTGGSEIPVTINNVEEYIELLQDSIAGTGIAQQVTAFREGFNRLFAIDDLKLLTHSELVSLFGKAEEDWTYATLADTIRADHGFTMESDPVRYLLEILSEMNSTQKREFLQFTTGSPRLPIGGWKALRPVFTVVRKIPEEPLTADDYLPSVMTCANYLKMPAYTSKEIMQKRLLTSMKEGQNSFLLS